MTTPYRYDVEVFRRLDGIGIPTSHENLTGPELAVLKVQEQCLPGRLVSFTVVRRGPLERLADLMADAMMGHGDETRAGTGKGDE